MGDIIYEKLFYYLLFGIIIFVFFLVYYSIG